MSDESSRDRGKLFENVNKKKPSQPDLQGDCTISGGTFEIRAWRRDDQLALSLAPPRGDRNTYPPDVFRGSLDPAPAKSGKGRAGTDGSPVAAWSGAIESDDAAYTVHAFEKQGKTSTYFTLSFDRREKSAPPTETPIDSLGE